MNVASDLGLGLVSLSIPVSSIIHNQVLTSTVYDRKNDKQNSKHLVSDYCEAPESYITQRVASTGVLLYNLHTKCSIMI